MKRTIELVKLFERNKNSLKKNSYSFSKGILKKLYAGVRDNRITDIKEGLQELYDGDPNKEAAFNKNCSRLNSELLDAIMNLGQAKSIRNTSSTYYRKLKIATIRKMLYIYKINGCFKSAAKEARQLINEGHSLQYFDLIVEGADYMMHYCLHNKATIGKFQYYERMYEKYNTIKTNTDRAKHLLYRSLIPMARSTFPTENEMSLMRNSLDELEQINFKTDNINIFYYYKYLKTLLLFYKNKPEEVIEVCDETIQHFESYVEAPTGTWIAQFSKFKLAAEIRLQSFASAKKSFNKGIKSLKNKKHTKAAYDLYVQNLILIFYQNQYKSIPFAFKQLKKSFEYHQPTGLNRLLFNVLEGFTEVLMHINMPNHPYWRNRIPFDCEIFKSDTKLIDLIKSDKEGLYIAYNFLMMLYMRMMGRGAELLGFWDKMNKYFIRNSFYKRNQRILMYSKLMRVYFTTTDKTDLHKKSSPLLEQLKNEAPIHSVSTGFFEYLPLETHWYIMVRYKVFL